MSSSIKETSKLDWAEEQAKRISDAEDKVRRDREWQLHVNAVINAEAPGVFQRLGNQMSAYVDNFNAARGTVEVRCDSKPDTIEVIKESARPSIFYRLSLVGNFGSVRIYKRVVGPGLEASDSYGELRFGVDTEGGIRLDGTYDVQRIAQNLLGEIFDSFRPRG